MKLWYQCIPNVQTSFCTNITIFNSQRRQSKLKHQHNARILDLTLAKVAISFTLSQIFFVQGIILPPHKASYHISKILSDKISKIAKCYPSDNDLKPSHITLQFVHYIGWWPSKSNLLGISELMAKNINNHNTTGLRIVFMLRLNLISHCVQKNKETGNSYIKERLNMSPTNEKEI